MCAWGHCGRGRPQADVDVRSHVPTRPPIPPNRSRSIHPEPRLILQKCIPARRRPPRRQQKAPHAEAGGGGRKGPKRRSAGASTDPRKGKGHTRAGPGWLALASAAACLPAYVELCCGGGWKRPRAQAKPPRAAERGGDRISGRSLVEVCMQICKSPGQVPLPGSKRRRPLHHTRLRSLRRSRLGPSSPSLGACGWWWVHWGGRVKRLAKQRMWRPHLRNTGGGRICNLEQQRESERATK